MADHNISALIDTAEALAAKMDAMRQAQRAFAAFSQEQVDRIFFEGESYNPEPVAVFHQKTEIVAV